MSYEAQQKHSLASLNRWQKTKMKDSRDNWWQAEAPMIYSQLEISSVPLPSKELLLVRKFLGQLIASSAGYRDFAAYHIRLNNLNANLTYNCGSLKISLHFFFSRILRRWGGRPPGPISSVIPTLLETPQGTITLFKLLESAKFFVNICPRLGHSLSN